MLAPVGVLPLHPLLDPFTSGADVENAATTLAVAALARPLRNRLQAAVDRRVYCRKCDAAAEIQGFVTRLRDQTDLDALRADICSTVSDTMQPAHVTLWVRSAQPSRRHR
ncbi:MAG: hypothetical protein DCC58_01950 [Chloroflexi bacterium]|nr:MAG: hypothetical protein DCC58_01950 [Chloroflexota bacterium]